MREDRVPLVEIGDCSLRRQGAFYGIAGPAETLREQAVVNS